MLRAKWMPWTCLIGPPVLEYVWGLFLERFFYSFFDFLFFFWMDLEEIFIWELLFCAKFFDGYFIWNRIVEPLGDLYPIVFSLLWHPLYQQTRSKSKREIVWCAVWMDAWFSVTKECCNIWWHIKKERWKRNSSWLSYILLTYRWFVVGFWFLESMKNNKFWNLI